MKTIRTSLHFDKDIVTFRHDDGVKNLLLATESILKDLSLSDELKSDGESDEDGEERDDEQDSTERSRGAELVVTLSEVKGDSQKMNGEKAFQQHYSIFPISKAG